MIKVLFICSGNSKDFEIPPFLNAQGTSLSAKGVTVEYFRLQGKGIKGYLKKVRELRKYLKEHTFHLLHAHYALSGWVAVLAFPSVPIVLSLMGTDAYGEYIGKNKVHFKSRLVTSLTCLIQPFVNAIISKSAFIEQHVYRKNISYVIPNGVRLEQFKIYNREIRNELGLNSEKKYILFLGDPAYKRKNFELALEAVKLLRDENIELLTPYPTSHENVVKYLNAVDVFIMTAFMEGSSNVIKEAMACNCPIVTTDAGDAKWVIGDTPGCFITSFDPKDVAEKLKLALAFAEQTGRTNGRQRIMEIGLDSSSVAQRIVEVYEKVLIKSRKN
jgi:glycosyltransferase involved in cell wall biosynthesis